MFFIIILIDFSFTLCGNVAIAHNKILNIELKIKNKKLLTAKDMWELTTWKDEEQHENLNHVWKTLLNKNRF